MDPRQPHQEPERLGNYRVEVGHTWVTVKGTSAQEALRAARLRLCGELPRMWDVIQTLDDACFRVMRLT